MNRYKQVKGMKNKEQLVKIRFFLKVSIFKQIIICDSDEKLQVSL